MWYKISNKKGKGRNSRWILIHKKDDVKLQCTCVGYTEGAYIFLHVSFLGWSGGRERETSVMDEPSQCTVGENGVIVDTRSGLPGARDVDTRSIALGYVEREELMERRRVQT